MPPLLLLHLVALLAAPPEHLAIPAVAAAAANDSQLAFLTLFKQSFSGDAISRWPDFSPPTNYCSFAGIGCDGDRKVSSIDLSGWELVGSPPAGICGALPRLRLLNLSSNTILGGFPAAVLNCSAMEVLDLSSAGITGVLPDLSPLRRLQVLDLSINGFSGEFPAAALSNLSELEFVNFNMNPKFSAWRPPESFAAGLAKLRVLILSRTAMSGPISPSFSNMTALVHLELAGNHLVGRIPPSLGKLANLQYLELYYNSLTGEVPPDLGNLTMLADVDLSDNRLTGGIPEALCALPQLRVLQLYSNKLTGAIPAALGNSTTLELFSVYRNFLSGEVPANLGRWSPLVVLELSENRLTGELPPDICAGGRLLYLLTLSNLFTGALPAAYGDCRTLLRLRVNDNHLAGDVPPPVFGLPDASIIDLRFNHFTGAVSRDIAIAKNLTSLFLSNNRFSGGLPPEISEAAALVKIDVSNNDMTGPIPESLGLLSNLSELSLQANRFDSAIPASLAGILSLSVLNLSNNRLTGPIPERLCALLPPSSLDLSNNNLSGPVPLPLIKERRLAAVAGNPSLCLPYQLADAGDGEIPLCSKSDEKRGLSSCWIIGGSAIVALLGVLLLFKRWRSLQAADADEVSSPPSSSYDVTSFFKLSFDHREIVDALVDKNIVGHGGSGTVYKVKLSGGELVAVKKLWAPNAKNSPPAGHGLDGELRSEVETLGSVRHKNIVKLYCCYSSAGVNLLVYEYLPNGNLWDALHGDGEQSSSLDWPTRRRIAAGVAQGLAYLHHGLPRPIVHRDIKSCNILLDADFEPKVADFGIAKVLHGGAASATTTIAGTHGYLAPEYAYTAKATTKCDVYSFGVVLMELVTGRKPIEPEFAGDIVSWASAAVGSKEKALRLLDGRLAATGAFKQEMLQALRIAARCTCCIPALRPTMAEVVQLLDGAVAGVPFLIKNSGK